MKRKRIEFSKLLICFETIIVAYLTYQAVNIANTAVATAYTGNLPYITTMLTAAWGAYATSAGFYYNKAKAENVKKIENTDLKGMGKDL